MDYNNDYRYNIVFFLECLATCHSVDKIDDSIFGDAVDLKILDSIKWKQERVEGENENKFKYKMTPKNPFFINEDLIINSEISNKFSEKEYSLIIIKRFFYYSKFQSMSVIVKNTLDGSYRYYIKGAPEKIHLICNSKSIPTDYDNILVEHTRKGYRVLACATKPLPNKYYENFEDRESYENNLTFIGFIIFKNRLKPDTRNTILRLIKANCKVVMSTGDNPYTSINVGTEAGFYRDDTITYMIESDNKTLKL
jgi:cation-transporting ATPase 13A3/4/5